MHTDVTAHDSSQEGSAGQSDTAWRLFRLAWLASMCSAIWCGSVGCHNIYREARVLYPSTPHARLELRIEEAREAEEYAQEAAARVRERLVNGPVGDEAMSDVDRFEMAARDLERRVISARDASKECESCDSFEAELNRLERHAAQMFNAVQQIHEADHATRLRLLDDLLEKTKDR